MDPAGRRVAVIGAGLTGLASADVLQRCGFRAVVYERSDSVGGQWVDAYADASLQNVARQYHLTRFPWPFKPDLHPTGRQILEYCDEAVKALRIDVRLRHEVLAIERVAKATAGHDAGAGAAASTDGAGGGHWRLRVSAPCAPDEARQELVEVFDHVVVCIGQYGKPHKQRTALPGEAEFVAAGGRVVTERDIVKDPSATFAGRRVAVVGFGKAALDMTMTARAHGAVVPVQHVFRSARWMLPRFVLGIHFVHLLFMRASTAMVPAWAHPTSPERALHASAGLAVSLFWRLIASLLTLAHRVTARRAPALPPPPPAAAAAPAAKLLGFAASAVATANVTATACAAANSCSDGSVYTVMGGPPSQDTSAPSALDEQGARQRRLELVLVPDEPLSSALRSALPLAPDGYVAEVAAGRIEPRRGEVVGLAAGGGLRLADGGVVPADVVVLSVGVAATRFPFLPPELREAMEAEPDGAQLYRHVILPTEPSIGFGGTNHCFLHIPAVEAATLWLAALWRGELELPPVAEMQAAVELVKSWKRRNCLFEPTRLSGTNVRFQQYLDVMLMDLGLNPYRRLPNVLSELLGSYNAADYAGIVEEYLKRRRQRDGAPPLRPLPLAM